MTSTGQLQTHPNGPLTVNGAVTATPTPPSASYTYVNEGDKELRSFSVDHDKRFRIPFIKRCQAATGRGLTLFASPWSPPAFMKTNNDMLHGGKLKPGSRQAWANYVAKFIKAYEAEGIPIWGLTVQNEPMATQTWESCIFSAEDERDHIKGFLGPTLKREGLADKKIIAWDHNRDLIYQRVSTILADPVAAQYVWGIGFHWYEPWSGGTMMFDNVRLVHEQFPEKKLIFTEGTPDSFKPEDIHSWRLGEQYGRSMINDFNDGAVGWTDWNVLLDEQGGPNHVGSAHADLYLVLLGQADVAAPVPLDPARYGALVSSLLATLRGRGQTLIATIPAWAPVHADTRTGELTYTNSYHYIGHFSKFVRPGARRIVSSPSRSALLSTAFVNPDGKVSVVVMNPTDTAVAYFLWVAGNAAEVSSPPHSIQTLVF